MKKFYIFILVCLMASTLYAHEEKGNRLTYIPIIEHNDLQDLSKENSKKVKASYTNGKLTIVGVENTVQIEIYNLLGRKVIDLNNIVIRGTFEKYIDLPKNNIYIVKISSSVFSKTFKIVAK